MYRQVSPPDRCEDTQAIGGGSREGGIAVHSADAEEIQGWMVGS